MSTFDDETPFEEALIKELIRNGWSDKVLKYPTEKEIIRNWADILFQNNRAIDRLNDCPLTDGEMQQIIEQISDLKTPLALNGFINGKTVSITRDNPDDPLHLGKEVSLKIYDRHEIAAGQSRYQIVRQPKFKASNAILPARRGDLMLLINGMPVIHIELKSSKVPVGQAANQIQKYAGENVFNGIFSLIQIFVAMNPEETLYFANPGKAECFNSDFFFHWADFNNNPINDWKAIASKLLSIPMAHQLIGFYTVADHGTGVLKVLRSYQYFAVISICNKVAQKDWTAPQSLTFQLGGYVWHTTGSGKTLTSFKSAQLIANSGDADKVVFILDRIELGNQSLEEYRGFKEVTEEVQETDDTSMLVSKLASDDTTDSLIVTSIQKMSLIREEQSRRRQADIAKIQNKRLVFIIDECHRSVFGDMLLAIKETFPRALLFGFTGTPIQDENKKMLTVTADIFGDELHRYSIADGIRDGNVLGFDPYKVLTYSDSELRKAVALDKAKAKTVSEALGDEKKAEVYRYYMNKRNVPMAGYLCEDGSKVKGIEDFVPNSQYEREGHRQKVVKDIIDQWPTLSDDGFFHAILATSSINEAIAYYRLLKAKAPELRITALFDPNIDNNGGHEYKSDGLVEIISDYNNRFGKNFSLPTHARFKKDIAARLAHKGQYLNVPKEQQLDILIVVDQMLTGFDSKWINTLYLDKEIVFENIIQAFSRTNRLFGHTKQHGTIRYYRKPHTMHYNIDRAINLYSGGNPFGVYAYPLAHNLKRMNEIYGEIKYLFERAGIEAFSKLPDCLDERGRFAKLFREFRKYLEAAKIQGFKWNMLHYKVKDRDTGAEESIDMEMNEEDFKALVARYRELGTGTGGGGGTTDVPFDIDTTLIEIDTGLIDADYMNGRFQKYLRTLNQGNVSDEERANVISELHRAFATLSQEQQRHANIFLRDVEQGAVALIEGKSFMDYVVEYQTVAQNAHIHSIAISFGLDESKLRSLINTHVTEANLNEFNRFTSLVDTVDSSKAKSFLEQVKGATILPFLLRPEIEKYLKNYILSFE